MVSQYICLCLQKYLEQQIYNIWNYKNTFPVMYDVTLGFHGYLRSQFSKPRQSPIYCGQRRPFWSHCFTKRLCHSSLDVVDIVMENSEMETNLETRKPNFVLLSFSLTLQLKNIDLY